ncbi:hypothetical protein KIW84_071834 [Lathyrus oleraceus]|uniref:Uncharacterized protein n=1 Tax=Pisum sativum TaxID=3888 RepID=A0A9D4VJT6_PEA|nr:hypothetical protein KIW84_071834 [Pisum sativum]
MICSWSNTVTFFHGTKEMLTLFYHAGMTTGRKHTYKSNMIWFYPSLQHLIKQFDRGTSTTMRCKPSNHRTVRKNIPFLHSFKHIISFLHITTFRVHVYQCRPHKNIICRPKPRTLSNAPYPISIPRSTQLGTSRNNTNQCNLIRLYASLSQPSKKFQRFLRHGILSIPSNHRSPSNLILTRQPIKQLPRGIHVPTLCISDNQLSPRNRIPVWHFIEHLPRGAQKPTFHIHINNGVANI